MELLGTGAGRMDFVRAKRRGNRKGSESASPKTFGVGSSCDEPVGISGDGEEV